MKPLANYPIWLSLFMLLGPFSMVGGIVFTSRSLIWLCQLAGAAMVMIALFYLARRLHEQSEEVSELRALVDERDKRTGLPTQ